MKSAKMSKNKPPFSKNQGYFVFPALLTSSSAGNALCALYLDCPTFSSFSKLLHNWNIAFYPGFPKRTTQKQPFLWLTELHSLAIVT